MIPFLDLKTQHQNLKEEILQAWSDILEDGWFVGGPWVEKFETEFAEMCDVKHCVSVSSGTSALIVALRSLGVQPGDEVILPANTFVATAESVVLAGAKPVLVDCQPGTWNIDVDAVKGAITSRTVGVIGVHLYGQPFDVKSLKKITEENNLWLLEDAAQAHFATLDGEVCGSLADIAAFSFYPGKNLGSTGEGGAVLTNNADLFKRAKKIRAHGSEKKYYHELMGANYRLPAIMAAGLQIKLKHILDWTESRRRNANLYLELLKDTKGIKLPEILDGANPVWHLFVIHVQDSIKLAEILKTKGIATGFHYPIPVHLQPSFDFLGHERGDFPNAEYNSKHCLSLPMFPELTEEQIKYVCTELKNALK